MSYTCGERLREYRTRAKMTQLELAEKCGLTERAIGNYERGTRVPDSKTIIKISDVLKVSPISLSEPILDDAVGIIHALIKIADKYNLEAIVDENKQSFTFSFKKANEEAYTLFKYLQDWSVAQHYIFTKRFTREEYSEWISKYPDFSGVKYGEETKIYKEKKIDSSETLLKHGRTHHYTRK